MTTADAPESAAQYSSESGDGAASLDGGRARRNEWGDRPLVGDLTTADIVREALAALRRDRVAPPEEALVPGMDSAEPGAPSTVRRFKPANARALTRRLTARRRPADPGLIEAGNPDRDPDRRPSGVGTAGRHRRRRRWLRGRWAWLAASVGVVLAVGIALLGVTIINQQGRDGGQQDGQSEVTADADASGQLPPGSAAPAAPDPTEPPSAEAGRAGSSNPTTTDPLTTPSDALGNAGQQPAVVSSLAAGDRGFGWPSSAFGSADG